MNFKESLDLCRKKRGIVNPNPGFVKQLHQFEKMCSNSKKERIEFINERRNEEKNKNVEKIIENLNNNDTKIRNSLDNHYSYSDNRIPQIYNRYDTQNKQFLNKKPFVIPD